MRRCLEIALLGSGNTAPNPMVGAVLVYENTIIGEGYHQLYGTAHAEVNCIKSVSAQQQHLISQSTMYVSLEPCTHFGKTPPCADLIIAHKIPKVIVGCRDPFEAVDGKGIEKLLSAGIQVEMSILEKECQAINKRFFTFHQKKRPYIILKWAQSANGIIGHGNGERLLISSPATNRLVHKWRSEEAAILVGTRTAMQDQPSLTNRLWHGKNPIRMVLDKNLSLPTSHPLLDQAAPTIVFNAAKNENSKNITFVECDFSQNVVPQILSYAYQNNIQSILVEGGATLLQSFMNSGLWEEARVITNENLIAECGVAAPIWTQPIHIQSKMNVSDDSILFLQPQSIRPI